LVNFTVTWSVKHTIHKAYLEIAEADPGFQVRGAHLKKIALSGGYFV
jgi:hypothetical protein